MESLTHSMPEPGRSTVSGRNFGGLPLPVVIWWLVNALMIGFLLNDPWVLTDGRSFDEIHDVLVKPELWSLRADWLALGWIIANGIALLAGWVWLSRLLPRDQAMTAPTPSTIKTVRSCMRGAAGNTLFIAAGLVGLALTVDPGVRSPDSGTFSWLIVGLILFGAILIPVFMVGATAFFLPFRWLFSRARPRIDSATDEGTDPSENRALHIAGALLVVGLGAAGVLYCSLRQGLFVQLALSGLVVLATSLTARAIALPGPSRRRQR
ncbi:MAG: hypothetical protein ABI743_09225 [bacterium]